MIKTYIQYENYSDELKVAVVYRAFNGEKYCLPKTTFKKLEQYEPAETFLSTVEGISAKDVLQSILDAAWEHGLRPTGFNDIKNETTALKNHLADMRRIAFAAHPPYNIIELDN